MMNVLFSYLYIWSCESPKLILVPGMIFCPVKVITACKNANSTVNSYQNTNVFIMIGWYIIFDCFIFLIS
jgi:hypothetical protein